MTLPWNERPVEVANLFNPAYLGTVLRKAIEGYVGHVAEGMPYEVAFLVPAFALHPNTARRLPLRPGSTPLHMWLQRDENRDVLVALSDRITALVPFVREALIFSAQRHVIVFTDEGRLKPGEQALANVSPFRRTSDEINESLRLGELVGRWFALAGSTGTIYTLLGVRP